MMDDSPSEAMNFGNAIAVTEEDAASAEHIHKLVDEQKSSENSDVAFPLQKKAEEPEVLFDFRQKQLSEIEDLKTILFQVNAPAEENLVRYTVPEASYFKPYIRKKIRQEVAFNRECVKLEKVWTNRGLTVNKETVSSAAKKDAFDLKDLSESLPSTSASRKHSCTIGNFKKLRSCLGQMMQDFESFKTRRMQFHPEPICPSSARERRRAALESVPVTERIPSVSYSLIETIENSAAMHHSLPREMSIQKKSFWAHLKSLDHNLFPSKPEKILDCDEQKEASKDGLNMKVEYTFPSFRDLPREEFSRYSHLEHPVPGREEFSQHSHLEHPVLGPKFVLTSVNDKQGEKEEEQSSDIEIYMPNPGLAPVPLMSNYVSQLGLKMEKYRWDSEKNWITKFDIPDVPAPLNSPVKKEEKTDKMEMDPFWSMRKKMLELQQQNIRRMRELSKVRSLISHRGVLPEDEDGSESEEPSTEEASGVSNVNNIAETLRLISLKKSRQMLRQVKESIKNIRTSKWPKLGCIKSDKVVPD